MNEPKPFASLSSTLLARKGQAKPAMRPQGFHMGHDGSMSLAPVPMTDHDDLGWNDMGHENEPVPIHANGAIDLNPEIPAVVNQQHELAREIARAALPVASRAPRALPGAHGKAAFTLRIDAERHLRLRLVCAVQHRSAQQIVTQALDEFLDRQPDNSALASRTGK